MCTLLGINICSEIEIPTWILARDNIEERFCINCRPNIASINSSLGTVSGFSRATLLFKAITLLVTVTPLYSHCKICNCSVWLWGGIYKCHDTLGHYLLCFMQTSWYTYFWQTLLMLKPLLYSVGNFIKNNVPVITPHPKFLKEDLNNKHKWAYETKQMKHHHNFFFSTFCLVNWTPGDIVYTSFMLLQEIPSVLTTRSWLSLIFNSTAWSSSGVASITFWEL